MAIAEILDLDPIRSLARPADKRSPLPAWAQVQRDLRRNIGRDIPVGYQLPTERELSEIYGVSRITIRQALSGLAADGYVNRIQGAGTFVSERPEPIQHDFGLTQPWRERFIEAGMQATSQQLDTGVDEPEPLELTRLLQPGEGAEARIHLKRVHTVNGRGIGMTDSWAREAAVPGLRETPLIDGSLSRTLSQHFGLDHTSSNHYLEVGNLDSEDATLLNASVDAPGILIWTITRLPNGRLLETSRTLWVATRVRFHYTS